MLARLKYWVAVPLLFIATHAVAQQQLYRWVDENGLVHYGDHVPPAYANQDREILNSHSVRVRTVEGAASDEELAERARQEETQQAALTVARERARLDRVLLATYPSVSEIERLRDQRLGLLEAQVYVTEQYITTLSQRLIELKQSAGRFKPYSPDPDALPVPENLALGLSQTNDSIEIYEETLGRLRGQHLGLTESFAGDIVRYRELTGS
jgi:hypothetical protein